MATARIGIKHAVTMIIGFIVPFKKFKTILIFVFSYVYKFFVHQCLNSESCWPLILSFENLKYNFRDRLEYTWTSSFFHCLKLCRHSKFFHVLKSLFIVNKHWSFCSLIECLMVDIIRSANKKQQKVLFRR